MKILTLNPPFLKKFSRSSRSPAISKGGTLYYPIWLAYATGVLEATGHQVRLVDAPAKDYDSDTIVKEAKKFSPGMIAMDTSTPSIHNDIKIAELLKEAVPESYIVLVGTHPSALPDETLVLSGAVDAVARGEYDYTLRDLASALESGKELNGVLGLSYRDDGRIVPNPNRPFIKELDALPFVSEVYKKHLRIEDYFYAANLYPVITIISGRGCPHRCVYCLLPQTLHGRGYRPRSSENFVDELEYIVNEFSNAREVFVEDDTMTADRKRCREISEIIKRRGLRITWSANSRADVDKETLRAMKSAGCRLLCVGFESGTQDILDNIHKGTRIEKIRQFMRDAKEAELLVHGCFMLGCPGETKQTLAKTIEFAKELNPDTAQFFPIMVYPGTEAYHWAKENGYLLTEDYSKWLDEEGMHNCIVSRPGLTNDELVRACDEARRAFYLRPRYILSTIKRAAFNPSEAVRIAKSSKTFFRHLLSGSQRHL